MPVSGFCCGELGANLRAVLVESRCWPLDRRPLTLDANPRTRQLRFLSVRQGGVYPELPVLKMLEPEKIRDVVHGRDGDVRLQAPLEQLHLLVLTEEATERFDDSLGGVIGLGPEEKTQLVARPFLICPGRIDDALGDHPFHDRPP